MFRKSCELRFVVVAVALLASTLIISGCRPHRSNEQPQAKTVNIAPPDKSQRIVMIILDLSGSFKSQMADSGKAWRFAGDVLTKYFRSNIGKGPPDRLILGRVSGAKASILWEGTPDQFRKQFNSSSFRAFLNGAPDPGGSLVYSSVAHALEYMIRIPAIKTQTAKSAVLVLSDFLDNGPDALKEKKRLIDDFVAYKAIGGSCGMYYVDQLEYVTFRTDLDSVGLEDFIIECDFKGHPTLPEYK